MEKLKINILLFLIMSIIFYACNQSESIPDKVMVAFTKNFPSAQDVKWSKENEKEWEAEFINSGKVTSANFDNNGNWVETEINISLNEVPQAVMSVLNTDFEGYEMEDDFEKFETPDQKGFEVIVHSGKKTLELLIDKDGKLFKNEDISGENTEDTRAEEDEEDEHTELENYENDKKKTILLGYRKDFNLENLTFSTEGRNKYFILEPGYQLVLEGTEEGEPVHLEITVTNQKKIIGDKVETRVVEEKEMVNGEIQEISQNYFAYCNETGDIFYFGEDVDIYEDGQVKGHEGAWHAFENEAIPGIAMPGNITIGDKYYMELAPGVAMDRAKNVSVSETMDTPSGTYTDCLKTQEGSALNPKENEFKLYAPNVGLIQDEGLLLVKHGEIGGM